MSVTRRQFLKITGTVAAGTGAAAVPGAALAAPAPDAGATVLPYPRKAVAAAAQLKVGAPVAFSYPDDASPCLAIRMGRAVPGGVGPDRDIVAYSTLCTHQGCPVTFDTSARVFRCPCHFSEFDAEMAGQMICGQATENLPRIVLDYGADGSITAVAVEGLIYGRQANVL